MKKRLWLGVAALLSFLLSLIALAPVATLFGWFNPPLGPPSGNFQVAGLEGTLYEGRVTAVTAAGRPLLERLHWKLSLRDLLLARLGVDLDASGVTLIDGHVSRGFSTLRADQLRVAGSLQTVLIAAGQAYLPLDGSAQLQLDELKLRGDWPDAARGTLRIDKLAWSLSRDPLVLGSYEATFGPDGETLRAEVKTLSGPLEVSGSGSARPDRSYELHLLLRPSAGAPPMIVNLLQSLGAPDAQGYYHLRREGKLP